VLLFAFDLSGPHDIYLGQFAQFDLRPRVGHIAGVRPALVGLIAQMVGLFGHGGIIEQGPNRGCAKLLSATSLGRLILAAVARSLARASPSPSRIAAGLAARNRAIGTCAVPCRREAPLGSRKPRSRGKSVVQLGPWEQFCRHTGTSSIQNRSDPRMTFQSTTNLRERFSDLRIVESCRAAPGIFQPKNGLCVPRAGAVSLCSAESEPPTVLQLILR
jgi:hypothetical protein